MSEIHVKENESLDAALKRFKRSCAKAGVLADLRKKEYYQSPSVKRRKKSEAARKNKNKQLLLMRYKISRTVRCGRFFCVVKEPDEKLCGAFLVKKLKPRNAQSLMYQ